MSPSDPITTEVISRHLLNTAEEAGVVLQRAAFSPNIKERHDCSTAIFNAAGEVIAQAHHIPIHLGSMIGAIEVLTAHHRREAMAPGDMFLANDPYTGGGSHLPDINVIAPVFHRGELVAFVANIAHHADVGGMVPGSEAAVCETIFQEGLRLPPVRVVRDGQTIQDVVEIIALNSRTPDERRGDLRAQLAANYAAIGGVERLFTRYGTNTMSAALSAFLDVTEQRFVSAIRQLPEGRYCAVEQLSGDRPDSVATIKVTLEVADERLHFDFEGTDPQLRTARNIPTQAVLATLYTAAKALLDPEVPANAGYFRTMDMRAPPRSIVTPEPPAPVGCRSISCGVLCDAVVAVLSQAAPQAGLCPSGPHHLLTWSGRDPRNGRYFVNYETVAGALGAFTDRDGLDAVRTLASGSANLPIEALEHAYPLRIERYALRDGSGGHGAFRGGNGIVRDYRVLGDDVTVSLSAERQHEPARGVNEGGDAATGHFILNPEERTPSEYFSGAQEVPVAKGDVLRVLTPGGAGFGQPQERSPELLARDLERQCVNVQPAGKDRT